MRNFYILLLLAIPMIGFSQVTLTSDVEVVPEITSSDYHYINIKFGLSPTFFRGYAYFYLSKDNQTLDYSEDILLGTTRIYGSMFEGGTTKTVEKYIPNDTAKDKYYIIMRVSLYITETGSYFKANYPSEDEYCINIEDDAPNCDPITLYPDLNIGPNLATVYSDCYDCPFNLDNIGNKMHWVQRNSGMLNISSWMENIGDITSPNAEVLVELYNSNFRSIRTLEHYDSSRIQPNGRSSVNYTLFASEMSNYNYGIYFIVFKLDPNEQIQELSEYNNELIVPFRYSNQAYSARNNPGLELSPIAIYDRNGNKIKTVSNQREEEVLKELNKGYYIIEYNTGKTRQILIK